MLLLTLFSGTNKKTCFPIHVVKKNVKLTAEGGKHILVKPFVNKKVPITVEIIERIFNSK